jgi:hypothetical protein
MLRRNSTTSLKSKLLASDEIVSVADLSSVRLRSLQIVLQDIEVVLAGRELTDQQKADLHIIDDGCRNILRELEKTLVKYEQVGVASDCINNKAKRVSKRLKWEPEDMREFRSRIIANITLLSAFQEKLAW